MMRIIKNVWGREQNDNVSAPVKYISGKHPLHHNNYPTAAEVHNDNMVSCCNTPNT